MVGGGAGGGEPGGELLRRGEWGGSWPCLALFFFINMRKTSLTTNNKKVFRKKPIIKVVVQYCNNLYTALCCLMDEAFTENI